MVSSELIRFPCSSTRASQRFFGKLLTRVDPDAQNGFGFEGTIARPGSIVPWEALWPTPAHPEIPILLECAGNPRPERGHRRHGQEDTYILWRFDPERKEWEEIARSMGESWTWAIDLRQVAIRALEESRGKQIQIFAGLKDVLARMRHSLDVEIQSLPVPDRGRAVAVLHDDFCVRLTRLAPVDPAYDRVASGYQG
jgi:hypothetical protein